MADASALRVGAFAQALRRLEEALERSEDDIVRDACIQRFEFTFEAAWRALQAYALEDGIECVSPRDCFRTGFRLGLVEENGPWIAMVEDRNRTTHTYDEDTAKAVYRALPAYARVLRRLLDRMREALGHRSGEARGGR